MPLLSVGVIHHSAPPDALETAMCAPGEWSTAALWIAARDLLRADGRVVDDEDYDIGLRRPPDEIAASVRFGPVRFWDATPLLRSARINTRRYQRAFTDHAGWEVRVYPVRNRQRSGTGQLLWRRQHLKSGHREDVYALTDRRGVPLTDAYDRLATAMLADAINLPGGLLGTAARNARRSVIARHFVGDVLWPAGDRTWSYDSDELIAWLDLHQYLAPPPSPPAAAPSPSRRK